jgi:hypothetical protein
MEDALSKWLSAKKAKEVVEKFKQRQRAVMNLIVVVKNKSCLMK